MKYAFETIAVGIGAFLALLGVAFAKDDLFEAHMWVLFFVLLVSTVLLLRRIKFSTASGETADDQSGYFDEVVRYGIIATFWGIVGFLVGVVVASQLAWPDLNIEPWLNFGRLRPLHTSAVIFAFGGNALLATSSTWSSAPPGRACLAAASPGSCSGATSCSS
jgi:cytochrome c oxidase cbb3-type subunit 1